MFCFVKFCGSRKSLSETKILVFERGFMLSAETLQPRQNVLQPLQEGVENRWQNFRTSVSRAAEQTRLVAEHVWDHKGEIARNAAKNTIENSPYIAAGAVARAVSAPLLTPIGASAIGAGVTRYLREGHQMDKKGAKRYFADNVLRHEKEDDETPLGLFGRVKRGIDNMAHGLEVKAVSGAFDVEENGKRLAALSKNLEDLNAPEAVLSHYQGRTKDYGISARDLLVKDMATLSLTHLTETQESEKRVQANVAFMKLYGALKIVDPEVRIRDLRASVWKEIKEDRKEAGHKSARGLALVSAAKAPVKVLAGAAIANGVGKVVNWIKGIGQDIQVDLNPTSEDIASMTVARATKKAAAGTSSVVKEVVENPAPTASSGVKVNGLASPRYNPELAEELTTRLSNQPQVVAEVEPKTITLTVNKGGSISKELQEAGILPDFNEKGSGKVILSLIDGMKETGKLTEAQAQELIDAIAEDPNQSWAELYSNHTSAFKGMDLVNPNFKFEVAIQGEESNIRIPDNPVVDSDVTNDANPSTTVNLRGSNLSTHQDNVSNEHPGSNLVIDANSQTNPDIDVAVENQQGLLEPSAGINLENAAQNPVTVSTDRPDILGFENAKPQGWVEKDGLTFGTTLQPNHVGYYPVDREGNTNLVLGFHAGYFTDPETGIKYEQIGEGFRQNMEGGALGSARLAEAQILENIKDAEKSNLEIRLTDESGNSSAYKLEDISYWSPKDVVEKGFYVRYPEDKDLLTVVICGRSHVEALNMLTGLRVPAHLNDALNMINNPNANGDQIMAAVAKLEDWLKVNNPNLYQKFYDHFYYKLEDGQSWVWSKYVLTFTKQN